MGLSFRLKSLLDRAEPGMPLWDLCCDHGLLGLAAYESGKFTEVVFNDSVPHVLELLAPQLIEKDNTRTVLALAEEINEPLTGNIIVAGVGGEKIYKILCSHALNGRLQARKVIVCPEKHAEWLSEQAIPGLQLKEHATIQHNHGTRQILVFAASSI
ncbi:MAG: SAM-dependent methyltransferase [Bdellovibrionales bacterium]